MSKKILITGATGLLGSCLYEYLHKEYQVVGNGFSNSSDFSYDLTDYQATSALLNETKPDIIINLIALTNVDECEENINKAYKLNVKPIENISQWMRVNIDCTLIHISTDQVYDGKGPFKEKDITLTNVYALSKYCSELAVIKERTTVLRTNFFGKSKNPNKKSFSDWLHYNFKKKIPLNLFTDVKFSPLSIITLQEMIGIVIENPLPGVFNLGSHNGMSKRDFALKLAEFFNYDTSSAKDALSSDCNLKAYRPKDMCMDSSLFEETFNVRLPDLISEIENG